MQHDITLALPVRSQDTQQGRARNIEECRCPPEYTGLSCQVRVSLHQAARHRAPVAGHVPDSRRSETVSRRRLDSPPPLSSTCLVRYESRFAYA